MERHITHINDEATVEVFRQNCCFDFVVTAKSVACRVCRRRTMPPSKDRRLLGRGVGVGAFTTCVDILSLNFFGVGIGVGCGFGVGWGFGGERLM